MFVKLAVILFSVATTMAAYNGPLAGGQPAALYPAGIDPQACPNFPNCASPLVAISKTSPQQYSAPQQQYTGPQQFQPQQYQQYQPQQYQPQQYQAPISQYNPVLPQQYNASPQSNLSPQLQDALNRGEYIGDGDYHGEGLAEALAPGYGGQQQYQAPQQYQPAQQYQQAPQYNARAYNQAPAAPSHAVPAQIPAGVNPQACPNYPFCH